VKYPPNLWYYCETCTSYWNLYDTNVKHPHSIWFLRETCISFSKLIWKMIHNLTPSMWNTLQTFGTNVKLAHPIETYIILMWNTLLPFETYMKHAHHSPIWNWGGICEIPSNLLNLMWNMPIFFESYMTLIKKHNPSIWN
jgi:hypothetical protein